MLLFKSITRRLASSIVVLLGLTVVIFALMKAVPGDPARLALGPNAPEESLSIIEKSITLMSPCRCSIFIGFPMPFKEILAYRLIHRGL
ncbi:MAG: hypothetical protein ACOX3P_00535 [Saccharofermentanales bacterium]|jgi:ABC-type dipeptide/oligopeptide/nickel transport system permease component